MEEQEKEVNYVCKSIQEINHFSFQCVVAYFDLADYFVLLTSKTIVKNIYFDIWFTI